MKTCPYCGRRFDYFGGDGWGCCGVQFCDGCLERHTRECETPASVVEGGNSETRRQAPDTSPIL